MSTVKIYTLSEPTNTNNIRYSKNVYELDNFGNLIKNYKTVKNYLENNNISRTKFDNLKQVINNKIFIIKKEIE